MQINKRVYLFAGHYGSGKTNLSVNFALYLRSLGYDVSIADLDIVNPYFRTKDSEEELKAAGIEVISPFYAGSNVDIPSLPSETYSLFQNREKKAVIDVGGDDRGALALGRFVPMLLEENNYEMYFTVNFFRPLTTTPADALEVMREIETACGLRFTGIVNNSNLGRESTEKTVISTKEKAEELSRLSSLPVVFVSAEKSIAEEGMFKLTLQNNLPV